MSRFIRHKNQGESNILDTENNLWIPEDAGNRDYNDLISSGEVIEDYTPPSPTLDEAKAAKNAEIKAAHLAYSDTGTVPVSQGYPMQIGLDDADSLKIAVDLAQMTGAPTISIVDANNVTHIDVAIADAQNVLQQVLSAFESAFLKKQQLRDQVNAATTVAEVEAIVVSFP